jgi:hypothetical protein
MAQKTVDPVRFKVDYSKSSDRLTVFFRLLLAIPILILFGMVAGGGSEAEETSHWAWFAGGGSVLVGPTLLMILFRQKYPRWWFDWNVSIVRFGSRVASYLLFLRDEYPSTDEEQSVHVDLVYPNVKNELNRWMPLVKWFLAIPHYIALGFLWVGVCIVTVIAWFAVLFTGQYPQGMFDFVVGFMRWGLRVGAYAFLLTTDEYPPFTLE